MQLKKTLFIAGTFSGTCNESNLNNFKKLNPIKKNNTQESNYLKLLNMSSPIGNELKRLELMSVSSNNFSSIFSKNGDIPRLTTVKLPEKEVKEFLEKVSNNSFHQNIRSYSHVPLARFELADMLRKSLGNKTLDEIISIIKDGDRGAIMFSIPQKLISHDNLVLLQTAIAYNLGLARCDASGNHSMRFVLSKETSETSALTNPYSELSYHTDGTFSQDDTDYLFFSKLEENNNESGGITSLMHIKEWSEKEYFKLHPMAKTRFLFKGPSSGDPRQSILGNTKNSEGVCKPLFYKKNDHDSFRFSYQYIHPRTLDEAKFITKVNSSLRKEFSSRLTEMPVGHMYLVNNNVWLHGRTKFENIGEDFSRVGNRILGEFYS